MLLYHDPRAPNPRRVRIFLAEKGVAYDTIEVSIATAAHLTPEFRKKNPLALLPVLELADGKILRAQIEQWNRHAELELLIPITTVFRNTNPFWGGRIKQSAEYGEIMREVVAG